MRRWALGLVGAALLAPSGFAARNFNLSVNSRNAERCSDLQVTSKNGEVARVDESVTLGARELSALELEDGAGHAVVQVRGWDRAEYQIETCRIAVAENRGAAEALVRGISVSRSAGRITTFGPNNADGNWQVYFLVRAPRNANLDLQTKNGPISVEGVSGNTKLRAVNGPVAVKDCGGVIDANTTNGPIAFTGRSGNVKLLAQNGPIAIDLTGDSWNGQQLDAKTVNGPVSLSIPENYQSGVRLQTSGHAPLNCSIAPCRAVVTDLTNPSGSRTVQLNGSADTVRVQTNNGPVSVRGPQRRMI